MKRKRRPFSSRRQIQQRKHQKLQQQKQDRSDARHQIQERDRALQQMDGLTHLIHRLYGPALPGNQNSVEWNVVLPHVVCDALSFALPPELCQLVSIYAILPGIACAITACRLGERYDNTRNEMDQRRWEEAARERLWTRAQDQKLTTTDMSKWCLDARQVELPESIHVRPSLSWNVHYPSHQYPTKVSIQWICPNCRLEYLGICRYDRGLYCCESAYAFRESPCQARSGSAKFMCTKPYCALHRH